MIWQATVLAAVMLAVVQASVAAETKIVNETPPGTIYRWTEPGGLYCHLWIGLEPKLGPPSVAQWCYVPPGPTMTFPLGGRRLPEEEEPDDLGESF